MKRRYFTIYIVDIKDLNTPDWEIEILFYVYGVQPDFVELSVQSDSATFGNPFLVEMKDGITSYKGILKMPYSNIVMRIVASPVIVDSNNERILKYEEGVTVDIDELTFPYTLVRVPESNEQTDNEFPIPQITHVLTYPKRLSGKSGAIVNWIYTNRKYKNYELLIRYHDHEDYGIISFKADEDDISYNLESQEIGTYQDGFSGAFVFQMSYANNPQKFTVQLRGVKPEVFPIRTSTLYSEWSKPVSFISAIALNSLKEFFKSYNMNIGIRQHLTPNNNHSFKKLVQTEDI